MKKKINDHSVLPGTLILLALLVVIFGLIFWWMYQVRLLILPDWFMRIFGIDPDADNLPWNPDALSEMVKEGRENGPDEHTFTVNYESLRQALLHEEKPQGLYLRAKASWGSKADARTVEFRRRGDSVNARLYNADGVGIREIVTDGDTLWYYDGEVGEGREIPAGEGFSPEDDIGMPSAGALLAVIEQFPAEGEESEAFADCELYLLETEYGHFYYAAFTRKATGLWEEYYLSLDYGIILSLNVMKNGQMIYTWELLDVSVDPSDWDADNYYLY